MPVPSPSLGSALRFDNSFVRSLPADPIEGPQARQVRGACFSFVSPTAVREPRLVAVSREVAELLGLSANECAAPEFAAGVRRQCSSCRHASRTPRATAATSSATGPGSSATGARSRSARSSTRGGERWELQLKGAGPRPYSRTRRRPRGAALVAARVPVQRGDASPRRADDARADPGRHRRIGRARHALRRPSARPSRARWSAASRRRSCASATSRSAPRATTSTLLRSSSTSRIARALPASCGAHGDALTSRACSPRSAAHRDGWSPTGCASASCTA